MVFRSVFPPLEIPQTDILSFLFPSGSQPSDKPIWIDAVDPSNFVTPRQLSLWARRLGFGLERLGVGPGDVCMTLTPNHIFVPVAFLGITPCGAAFSGCNPSYTVPEVTHQLSNTGAKVFFVHPTLVDVGLAAAAKAGLPRDRVFLFDQNEASRNGVRDWRTMAGTEADGRGWTWRKLDAEMSTKAVATINYSSGTTGLPKGVCISHHNLIANVLQNAYVRSFDMRPKDKDRWIGFLPLYHAFGQLYTILMVAKLGIPTFVMKAFHFEEMLRVIQTHKVTAMHTAPPVLVMLAKRPETSRYDLSSLLDILCGAAPLSRELQNEVSRKLNVRVVQGWGMTELTCTGLSTPGNVARDDGTVGLLIPNSLAKIVDEEGKEVGPGERGEIYIKGPQVCLGYWRNEEATKDTLIDGWMKTGDIAMTDDQGFWWIVDRKKELIKVNGLQVAPAELEAALLENPDVADAAAVGITIDGTELPRAYVVLTDSAKERKVTPADIQAWIKARVVKHKQLAGGVVFIDEVPKLASGKIQRKVMREWAKRDAERASKDGTGPNGWSSITKEKARL